MCLWGWEIPIQLMSFTFNHPVPQINMVITKAKFWMHAKFYKYGIGWLQISSNPVLYICVALSVTLWCVIPFTVNCPGKRAFWWILFTNGHFDEIGNIFPTLVCEWFPICGAEPRTSKEILREYNFDTNLIQSWSLYLSLTRNRKY